ncbi:hypothetical protein [Bordetella phage CN2]|uniref:Uncharacterized protein n=1 Tax=Bordetella phage CN2 TaxID=1916124 RepID=A0A2D0W9B8_9CAUD|nr:hypothetical protein HOS30_gp40 [Bordetella phage CN2]APL99258.1 hypothetical protein [Bordetella phage CN2]
MNLTQRISFLKKANNLIARVHDAAGNLPADVQTVDQLAASLENIRDLEVALAALRAQAEAAVKEVA